MSHNGFPRAFFRADTAALTFVVINGGIEICHRHRFRRAVLLAELAADTAYAAVFHDYRPLIL